LSAWTEKVRYRPRQADIPENFELAGVQCAHHVLEFRLGGGKPSRDIHHDGEDAHDHRGEHCRYAAGAEPEDENRHHRDFRDGGKPDEERIGDVIGEPRGADQHAERDADGDAQAKADAGGVERLQNVRPQRRHARDQGDDDYAWLRQHDVAEANNQHSASQRRKNPRKNMAEARWRRSCGLIRRPPSRDGPTQ
jgi:hypothetical protein